MILFSAKKSAVHDMHLDAIDENAAAHGLAVSGRVYGLSAIWRISRSADRTLFSQSTGVASLVVLPLARIWGKRVVHYMHEPTPLRLKLKDNPPIKSVVWHAVQWVEMRCATTIMVSRQALLDQAAAVYGVSKRKIALAPLLMPKTPQIAASSDKIRITYLGRIDKRRFFQEFLEAAPALKDRGYRPTILTGDTESIRKHARDMPDAVDLFAETNFSEDLKARVLGETCALWNPKRGSIAQSGVTADAVRYGLTVLLTDKDPQYGHLVDKGIALDFYAAVKNNLKCLDRIDTDRVASAAEAVFSEKHGKEAFETSYLPFLR